MNSQQITFAPSSDGRSITITSENLTREGSAPVEAFKAMKDYYDAVIKLSKERIILRKIKP